MALNFNDIPDQASGKSPNADLSGIPNRTQPKKLAEVTQDEEGNLVLPKNDNALKELGKTALRSVLEITKAPFDLTSAVSRQLEKAPGALEGAPASVKAKRGPLLDKIAEVGRVSSEFHSGISQKITEKVESIESLKPSERIKKLTEKGLDSGKLSKAFNLAGAASAASTLNLEEAETALQLGAQGFGSLAVSLATGSLLGTTVPAVLLAAIEGEAAARDAQKAGKNRQVQADVSLATVAGVAILEKFGLDRLLKGSGKRAVTVLAKKGVLKNMAKTAKGAAKEALEGFATEGGTEGAQQIWQNLVAKVGFDKTKGLLDGVLDAVVAGGISGSTAGGSISTLNTIKSALKTDGVTQAMIDQAEVVVLSQIMADSAAIDKSINDQLVDLSGRPMVDKEVVKADQAEFNKMLEENQIEEPETNIEDLVTNQRGLVGEELQGNQERVATARSEGFVTDEEFDSLVETEQQDQLKMLMGIRKNVRSKLSIEDRATINEQVLSIPAAKSGDELNQIYDNIEAIASISRQENVEIEEAKQLRAEATKDVLTKQAEISDPEIFQRDKPIDKSLLRLANIETQSAARYFDSLDGTNDGSGVNSKEYVNKINDAEDASIRAVTPIEGEAKNILKDAGLNEFNLSSLRKVGEHSLSLNNMMYIYAARKSPDNLAAVVFGNKIHMKTVKEIPSLLTEAQRNAADKLADLYGIGRETTNEVLLQVSNGKEALSQVAGRYMTIERAGLQYKNPESELKAENQHRKGMRKAKVKDKFKIDRTVYDEGQTPVRLDLIGGLIRHTRTRERHNAYAPVVQEIRAVFDDPDYQNTLLRHKKVGPEGVRIIDRYLNLATDESFYRSQSGVAPLVDGIRANTAVALLGIKGLTVLKQAPSYALFAGHMSRPDRLLTGIPRTLANWNSVNEFVNLNDPQMATRIPENEMALLQKEDPKLFNRLKNKFGLKTLAGITMMDRLITVTGWKAVYDDAMTQPGMTHEKAVRKAKNSVLRTQPVSKFKDLPFAFNESEARLFTLFGSQLAQIGQIAFRDAPRSKSKFRAAITQASVLLNQYLIYSLVYGKPPEDEEDWINFAKTQISWLIPIVGPTVAARAQGFSGVPSGAVALDQMGILAGGNKLDKKARAGVAMFGIINKFPATGLLQAIEGAQQFAEEVPEAENLGDVFNAAEGFFRSQSFQKFKSKESKAKRAGIKRGKVQKAKLLGQNLKARLIKSGIITG